jgi:hypothetical protein
MNKNTNIATNKNTSKNKDTNVNTKTSLISYNYSIIRSLFNNTSNKNMIENEITKLIILQIDLIIAFYSKLQKDSEQLDKINSLLFKDSIIGQGQIMPTIRINGVDKQLATILELKNTFIPSLNFREKMSIIRNFISSNTCIMYPIIIEYKNNKKNNTLSNFTKQYPMLNTNTLDKSIIMIEQILGFDIEETNKCYDDITGTNLVKCSTSRLGPNKPFYEVIQNENNKNPVSPITLCWLWHPLVYGVPYQNVVKLPGNNSIKKLLPSYIKNNQQQFNECMTDVFSKYPVFPKLSSREKNYLKSKGIKSNIQDLYTRPPWTPPYCIFKRPPISNFNTNLTKRYNKFTVSNLSGHTMLFIIMARYFKEIDLNLIVLASLLFMVPYNHSIHEILQAGKLMDVNTNYTIKNTDLDNLNNLLKISDLKPITIPINPVWMGGRKYTKRNKSKRKITKSKRKTRKTHY